MAESGKASGHEETQKCCTSCFVTHHKRVIVPLRVYSLLLAPPPGPSQWITKWIWEQTSHVQTTSEAKSKGKSKGTGFGGSNNKVPNWPWQWLYIFVKILESVELYTLDYGLLKELYLNATDLKKSYPDMMAQNLWSQDLRGSGRGIFMSLKPAGSYSSRSGWALKKLR